MKTQVFQEKFIKPHTATRRHSVIFIVLLTVILLMGCDPPDSGFIDNGLLNPGLIGKWEFDYGSGKEEYTVTGTTFYYSDDWFGTWGGSIVHVSNFSNNSGVIIIEYDSDKKQQWIDWDTYTDITPPGNFYGIYYGNLTANTVIFGNTNDLSNNYGPTETETLEEAKNKFTRRNRGNFIDPSVGSTQIKVF